MLIDFRARPNTAEFMRADSGPDPETKWRRWGYPKPPEVSLADYVAAMDAAGIAIGVFTGRTVERTSGGHFGLGNDYVARCVGAYPDRIVGFAGVDMSRGEEAARELERAVAEFGFRGASLDPRLSKVLPDERVAYPIYECAARLGIPVVFTMGPFVGRFSAPDCVDRIAVDFPTVDFVCSHAPWPQVYEYLALCYRRLNVTLEPSLYWSLPGNQPFFEAANGLLSEQVVYGSGHPFNPLNVADRFRAAIDWTDEAWARVSWSNAARLLRLDQRPLPGAGPASGATSSRT
ncbi:MAG: amidohydrolase family protein [Lautropia sp.]